MIASATVMSFPEYQRNYKVLQFMNLDLSYAVAHPITVEQSLLKQLQTDVNVVKKRRAINLDLKFGDLIEKSKSDCQSETQFD